MVNICSKISQFMGSCCPVCHAPGDGLCPRCREALPRNDHACPRCAFPLPAEAAPGTLCVDCQRHPPDFDHALVPLRYAPPVDTLIGGFKYQGRLGLGRILADLLAEHVAADPGAILPSLLLPVPMHPAGLRERGFNQAAELARQLADRCGISWSTDSVRRRRQGEHQRGLGRIQRRRNLTGAFACDCQLPRHVAIVDDVVTTATTAAAVSQALRQAGAERIDVWAVARTGRADARE